MFTGIVEEIGTIFGVKSGANSAQMTIQGKKVLERTQIGDSISVNGVCLTVIAMKGNNFVVDVMAETFRRSNLGKLKINSKVNLERAMAADGRFGGHIVSGHIDGTGTIVHKEREENAVWLTIKTTPKLLRYIVEKGSIAIDGVSLTVAALQKDGFQVSIIPHTGSETTLLHKAIGDPVNLENDIIGKYVERLMQPLADSHNTDRKIENKEITTEFLRIHGF
ncbi:riboflavin synthase [Anaerovorax sp. IOR16]|uniref:riboflavin synthase n=1 Tax=Anaerovorax sp. IOR16 TaxID=2773458 RepID=UPI0019D1ACF3|nr:riboflavin synthase [Anaerovorax sp. IOR16]